jgi:hypothetical protein
MIKWWEKLQYESFKKHYVFYRSEVEESSRKDPGYILNIGRFSPTLLQTPSYLSPCLLPDKEKVINELINIMGEVVDNATSPEDETIANRYKYMLYHIVTHLESGKVSDSLQEFVNYSADLDKLREQNLKEACPELWDQIKDLTDYKGKL